MTVQTPGPTHEPSMVVYADPEAHIRITWDGLGQYQVWDGDTQELLDDFYDPRAAGTGPHGMARTIAQQWWIQNRKRLGRSWH